jgi:hypothetical protein
VSYSAFTIRRGKIVQIELVADPGCLRQLDSQSSTADDLAKVFG